MCVYLLLHTHTHTHTHTHIHTYTLSHTHIYTDMVLCRATTTSLTSHHSQSIAPTTFNAANFDKNSNFQLRCRFVTEHGCLSSERRRRQFLERVIISKFISFCLKLRYHETKHNFQLILLPPPSELVYFAVVAVFWADIIELYENWH